MFAVKANESSMIVWHIVILGLSLEQMSLEPAVREVVAALYIYLQK